MRRIHSGVAVRLLAGLSIMAALAVSASLIGHFAVDGYQEPFRRTASVDLPNLVSTSQLAQDAVSLTASASDLVLAPSQPARRAVMARIQEQIGGMTALVNRFPETFVAAGTVRQVVGQGEALAGNLMELDRRIGERIDLDMAIEQALAGLHTTERTLSLVSEAAGPGSGPGSEAGAVRAWQRSAQHALVLLALVPDAARSQDLGSLGDEIARSLEGSGRQLARMPPGPAEAVAPLQRRLEQLGRGEGGLPALKARRFEAEERAAALRTGNKVLSDGMVALVAGIAGSIEGMALQRSAAVTRSSERQSMWLMVIALICVGSAVVIIVYINRNVIRRLRELVGCMINAVKGDHNVAIPAQADDEIGELGRAFQYFVEAIKGREAALLASERRLADIINLLPDATMVIDLTGTVQFWNRAMEIMTGITAAEMVGKGNYEYALPFYGERRPILVDMVLQPDAFIPGAYPQFEPHGDTLWGETGLLDLRGRPVCLRGSASILRDAGGRAVGGIETIFDITERRDLIEALRKARDTAERASQAKSIFLATMSHELRTPLNSIIGFAEFVSSQTFGAVGDHQYLEHAGYARQSAHHLLDIINGMLDLSKIEAGMMQLEHVRVPVAPIVRRCVRMVQDLAFGAGVSIKVAVPANITDLWADERAMRQILINLLGNAIKFNVQGGSILVTALEAGDFIDIVVADTGAGIPTDEIERVRKPFEQINNQYTRAQGGTGLGLSIVEGLVDLHGGSLTIASAVGKGTAVTARFPRLRDAVL